MREMNGATRILITGWLERASGENDPFIKMFISFMCLDAYMTQEASLDGEFNSDSDEDKLRWLETKSLLTEVWQNHNEQPFQKIRAEIAKRGPVRDMRPKHLERLVGFDDNDFGSVIRFIYQVRCNLFHGGKDVNCERDRVLCDASASILCRWVSAIVESYRDESSGQP